MKPPSIILLTPNGRFSINKKICLSISGYHPETWQPSWSVRTALLALIAFMPTKSNRAIGSLDFSDAERRKLAEKSRAWRCETCGLIKDLLKHPEDTGNQNGHGEASTSKGVDASNCNDGVKHEDNPSPKETSERDNSEDSQSTSQPEPRLEPKINSGPADEPSRREKAPEFGGSSRECNNDNQVEWPTNGFSENVAATVTQRTPTQDNRRTYPTLVYASIFILLFLLVLRRIVMVVQS